MRRSSWLTRGRKGVAAVAAAAAVIAGAVVVATQFGHKPLATGSRSAKEAYRLGYQCAQSVWVVAENDPNAQAVPTGQFQSMLGSCRAEARDLHVSFAPASPFRSGFMAGFDNPRGPSG